MGDPILFFHGEIMLRYVHECLSNKSNIYMIAQ
jgi:hypothetical protein